MNLNYALSLHRSPAASVPSFPSVRPPPIGRDAGRTSSSPSIMTFEFLPFLSTVFGWIYFLCWSLSFYPQPILNFQRRSTSGTTIDFPLLNNLGFLAYLVSNLAFYYSPLIRAQYAARHHGLAPTVQFNDIAFAAHALLLSLVIITQYWRPIWGFPPSKGVRPSRAILGVAAGCMTGVLVAVFIVLSSPPRNDTGPAGAAAWTWLDAVYAVGYVKVVVTVIKYTPQLVANYRNRSTRGWAIGGILLDFAGGVLSLAQLVIDSSLQGDWSGVTGNPVKFALGNVSILYDMAFFTQHWVLYRDARGKAEERDSLLGRQRDEEDRRID